MKEGRNKRLDDLYQRLRRAMPWNWFTCKKVFFCILQDGSGLARFAYVDPHFKDDTQLLSGLLKAVADMFEQLMPHGRLRRVDLETGRVMCRHIGQFKLFIGLRAGREPRHRGKGNGHALLRQLTKTLTELANNPTLPLEEALSASQETFQSLGLTATTTWGGRKQ